MDTTRALETDRPSSDAPTADLPTDDLPTADLPTADLPTADRSASSSSRLLLLVGAGVAALVVVALAVVLFLPRGEATYPAGSPEAAFQAYLAAADAYDLEATYQAMSPRVRQTWTYDQYVSERGMYGPGEARRSVWIDRVDRTGGRAVLHVTIEWISGGGLTASRWYDRDIPVTMVLDEGTWYIDQRLVDTYLRY